jgi:hypothetical protein
VNLALGIIFLWLGAACIFLAAHGTEAKTPWQAYSQIIGAVSKGVDD